MYRCIWVNKVALVEREGSSKRADITELDFKPLRVTFTQTSKVSVNF